ncbi:MAG: hypothetical protein H0Z37_03410 [Firmicutes bacterium]|nr:hypothetical protein [Bacillota bacterium]
MQSVRVGIKSLKDKSRLWGKLLMPHEQTGPAAWQVGSGPMIELVESDTEGIHSMLWLVRDLAQAEACLQERGIDYQRAGRRLNIDPDSLLGLNVQLADGSENHVPGA